jgi:hypothetical protein
MAVIQPNLPNSEWNCDLDLEDLSFWVDLREEEEERTVGDEGNYEKP